MSEVEAETKIISSDQHIYLNDLIVTTDDDFNVGLIRSNVRS